MVNLSDTDVCPKCGFLENSLGHASECKGLVSYRSRNSKKRKPLKQTDLCSLCGFIEDALIHKNGTCCFARYLIAHDLEG